MTRRGPKGPMPWGVRLLASFALLSEVAPFAPATFASLAMVPLLWFYLPAALWVQGAITIVVTWIGILVSNRAELYYGHDAGAIVIDEVAGMLVTFLMIPVPGASADRWWVLLAGFFLFRVMDIVKPFPAGRAQNLPGGTGVMTDDLIAGLYANLALRIAGRLLGWF